MASVRRGWWSIEVTTGYRPRTDVERWQLQDRLTARLRDLGLAAPRFYERAGRLVFGLKRGRGLTPELLRRLEAIDAGPGSGAPSSGYSSSSDC